MNETSRISNGSMILKPNISNEVTMTNSEVYEEEYNGTASIEDFILTFSMYYDEIHIPLSIFICIFGFISNIINIIVLTRKRMRTPINILLTGLSAAQWLLATNYLFFLILENYRTQCYEIFWSKTMTYYRLVNVNLNVVFHTTAFMTTIVVAVFRYCALKYPIQASRHLYKSQLAVVANITVWIIVPIICAPVFFSSKVIQIDHSSVLCQGNKTMSSPLYNIDFQASQKMVSVVFWMFGIVLKVIPSFLLTVLLIALIRSLNSVERRRNKWKREQSGNGNVKLTGSQKKAKNKFASRPRTTRMLVIILLLCVIVEFPNGLLNLCVAIYGDDFGVRIYNPLGNLMEMMTLLYSSVSFILYCTMSNDFLTTFRILFLPWTLEDGSNPNSRGIQPNNCKSSNSLLMVCDSNSCGPQSVVVNPTPGESRTKTNSSVLPRSARMKTRSLDDNMVKDESQLALLTVSPEKCDGENETISANKIFTHV
ncbi:hypothetical protein WR25_18944 [Diploscapter pachys]|uniref:G-protein coupled receptors family 1 profile domain-containing protein n=1 Tax=Diploscapter pachys TaxID=2018661 RepID=A0A2A2K958_9BILA|nr:hypothetical protein WR25_18944 [Diploscapter pachys]